jgi:hypothetical protein
MGILFSNKVSNKMQPGKHKRAQEVVVRLNCEISRLMAIVFKYLILRLCKKTASVV